MGDYAKISNFNPDANFSLVRFGGDTPITELELNETQMLLSHRIKALTQSVIGDRFLEGGTIALNTETNEFIVRNQALINEGRNIYVTVLKGILNSDETIYLDVYEKEITKDSEIKLHGNTQETSTVSNTLLDPRLEGIETARRMQICYDLVKEVSRVELTSTDPIVNIGGATNKSKLGVNSKLLQIEGNSYQHPDNLDIDFVGTPIDGKYVIDITTTGDNLFKLNTTYEGTDYEVGLNSLTVKPKTVNTWNGLTCKLSLNKNTMYAFQCQIQGKTMIQVLDMNKQIIAVGNKCTFDTKNNDFVYITFYCGCGETLEGEKAVFSNIMLYQGTQFKNIAMSQQSTQRILMPMALAKVGNYKDILTQNSLDEWNIYKNTKTTKFNGKELINGKGWTLALEGETTNCFKLEKACTPSHNNDEVETNLNTYALPKSYNEVWTTEIVGSAVNTSGDLVVRLTKEVAPSLDVFKNLLGTNNMEVTFPIYKTEVIEDVVIEQTNLTKALSLDGEEESVITNSYKGVNNVITIEEPKNGYTNNVYIEGNTVYTLPLDFKESQYLNYDKGTNIISNLNKSEFRSWDEVEALHKLDKNTDYTISFVAKTDLMCEIPCAEAYPTVQANERYTIQFNSKENEDFKIKIWSSNPDVVASIENLQLYIGKVNPIPTIVSTKSISNPTGLTLESKGLKDGELDVQKLMYKLRGFDSPLTDLRSLPNGEKDLVTEHEDEKYYYHKKIDQLQLTGREMKELVGTTPQGKLIVDLTKVITKAQPTTQGNTYCDKFKVKSEIEKADIKGICITPESKIRIVVDPSELETPDVAGVTKLLKDTTPTITYTLVKEEVYECPKFDTRIFMGHTKVTLGGTDLITKITCSTRENEGLGLYTLDGTTNILFNGISPSKVTYVANFQPKLEAKEGHVYIPLATRVRGELVDLRIFDPNVVDFVNEAKDLTTGVYTVVKALRQNGTIKYSSTLSDKDERGNYTILTVRHYDPTGKIQYRKEKYRLNYDLDGDMISKELMKQW